MTLPTTTMQPQAEMPAAARAYPSTGHAGRGPAVKAWPDVLTGIAGDLSGFESTNRAPRPLGRVPT